MFETVYRNSQSVNIFYRKKKKNLDYIPFVIKDEHTALPASA